jgi:preprotein translocase subunit SecF
MVAMPHRTGKAMTQSTRKLLGTVLILASLVIWSVLGMWIYMSFLGAAAWWLLIGFFAVMGMSWFYPATWIIRWMAKPDQ